MFLLETRTQSNGFTVGETFETFEDAVKCAKYSALLVMDLKGLIRPIGVFGPKMDTFNYSYADHYVELTMTVRLLSSEERMKYRASDRLIRSINS